LIFLFSLKKSILEAKTVLQNKNNPSLSLIDFSCLNHVGIKNNPISFLDFSCLQNKKLFFKKYMNFTVQLSR